MVFTGVKMEYRKLISFGKSSFVVSLPKSWIKQNKLKKGDLIHFEDEGNNLVIKKKEEESLIPVEKERTINITNKDIEQIKREVYSSYILNFRTIVLKGDDVRTNISKLQQIFHDLIALEIMEVTSNSIVAKDFLDMDKVSVKELISKMDIITRAMFKECCTEFTEKNYFNINDRDKDVNRLFFLLYRTIYYNLDNPFKAIKNLNHNPIQLFNFYLVGYYLEGIADEVRRTARFAHKLKISEKEKSSLRNLLERLNDYYLETIKSVNSQNVEKALELSSKRHQFHLEIDKIEKDNIKIENYQLLVARIRRLVSYTHNLGRLVYQGFNY